MAPTISQDIIEFYIVSKIDETGEVNGRIKKCYAKKSHFSSARKKNWFEFECQPIRKQCFDIWINFYVLTWRKKATS